MLSAGTRSKLLASASALALSGILASATALAQNGSSAQSAPAATAQASASTNTATPIKHVVIIVGENRTFDHVFGLYKPKAGQTVSNILSKGIVHEDGSPGPHFGLAKQFKATDTTTYSISPTTTGPYSTLPPPETDGSPESASDTNPPPFATVYAAKLADHDLPKSYYKFLTTGASGLPNSGAGKPPVPDTRIKNVTSLLNGPFPLEGMTQSLYDAYTGSPVHRFYQMWQQTDCSAAHKTSTNPSGCLNDLFPWVEVTIGAGSNGNPPQNPPTGEGSISMGFFNVLIGDMPYFTKLANDFAINDNYHQPVMGGTGANSIMIGAADAYWYSDGKGNPKTPPTDQIENPNPMPGTNNWYTQDGYSGGTYSNCSDPNQPGVSSVVAYLKSLNNTHLKPNCEPGHYYLLNNYNPGYFGDGQVDKLDTFAIPPVSVRTIGDELLEKQISWAYYGEGWNQYVQNPTDPNDVYCNICNPFQYVTSIMTNPETRQDHLKDTEDLYAKIDEGTLPAVSFVKPGGLNDGHPASSKFDIFEGFVKKIVNQLQLHPDLWQSTAVFITVDEGGGYWDSGYIQPLDFFGDGTRIPLIVASPWAKGGRVVHSYSDHASLLKFIEANWKLSPITARSRDNLPNPITTTSDPYVPTNGPAIGDLMDMFNF